MRKMIVVFLAGLVFSANALAAPSKGEDEVRQFIQRMYAFSTANFELAYFDGRLNLKKHCDLLKQFFVEALIRQPTINSGCGLNEFGSIRYPSLSAVQISDSFEIKRIPKAVLSEPRLVEGKASMSVTAGNGRSIYFLEKTANDWRIANVLLYEKWPSSDGVCSGTFLSAPTPDQKKNEPKSCRE